MNYAEQTEKLDSLINLMKEKQIKLTMLHYGISEFQSTEEEEYDDDGYLRKFISSIDMKVSEAYNMLLILKAEGVTFSSSVEDIHPSYTILEYLCCIGYELLNKLKGFEPDKIYNFSSYIDVDTKLEKQLSDFYKEHYERQNNIVFDLVN